MASMTKLLIAMIALGMSVAVEARRTKKPLNTFPPNCNKVGYEYKFKQLVLYPEKAGHTLSMYFMFNKSDWPVTLYQTRGDEDAYSSHLINTIQPKRWAALSLDTSHMKFICTKGDGRKHYGRITDCEELLKVCEYDNVLFGVNNRGNYWAVTSSSRNTAVRTVVRKHGILLR